ncbi:O-antigen ligase family protein, partial [Pyxidicoccus sp. 3LG]
TVRSRSRALPYALAAGASGLGVVLTLSRGGIAFFVFGQALLVLLLLRRRHAAGGRAPPVWTRSAAALLGLLAVLSVGAYAAADRLWTEARSADSVEELRHSKVALWPMMAQAARAFPVLGMGRGAFEAAFPRHQSEPNPNTFTHPENAVLQAAVELGVPGLVLLLVGAWGFLRLLRREGLEPLELAALAGVAALALHDLFDFSLELPACAVAALVVLGAVARPRERERGTPERSTPERSTPERGTPERSAPKAGCLKPSPLLLGTGVGLTVLGLVALVPGRHHLSDAEAELAGLVDLPGTRGRGALGAGWRSSTGTPGLPAVPAGGVGLRGRRGRESAGERWPSSTARCTWGLA